MDITEAPDGLETIQKVVQDIGSWYWKQGARLPRTHVVNGQNKLVGYGQPMLDLQLHDLRIVQPYLTSFVLAARAGWRGQKSKLLIGEDLRRYANGWIPTLIARLDALATRRMVLPL